MYMIFCMCTDHIDEYNVKVHDDVTDDSEQGMLIVCLFIEVNL